MTWPWKWKFYVSSEKGFYAIWIVGNLVTLWYALPFAENRLIWFGVAIFGFAFWTWFARSFLLTINELRELDKQKEK